MHILKTGLETISNNPIHTLGPAIEKSIQAMRAGAGVRSTKELKPYNLDKIIKKITGLSIKFIVMDDDGAAVLVPDIDKNSVLLTTEVRPYFKSTKGLKLLKEEKTVNGSIDLEKIKVSGVFTECTATIYLSNSITTKGGGFIAKEAAAIILHEIGHYMEYLSMLGTTVTDNYVLNAATNAILDTVDTNKRIVLIKQINKQYDLSLDTGSSALRSKNKDIISVAVISNIITKRRSTLGNDYYDRRGFEQLADAFAARLGYAVPLATALDKMFRMRLPQIYMSAWDYYLSAVLTMFALLMNPVFLGEFIILDILSGMNDDRYDTPKDRINTLMNDRRILLRNKDISNKDKELLMDDIDALDTIATAITSRDMSLLKNIYKSVFPVLTQKANLKMVQQALERLMATRITEAAKKLEQLK